MESEASQGPHVARFTPANLDQAAAEFNKSGVIIVDELYDRERIAAILGDLRTHYPAYVDGGELDDYFRVGYRRYNAPLPFKTPFDLADVVLHPVLDSLLGKFLGKDYVFEAIGTIFSRPGASDQNIHRDGGLLFPEGGVDRVLPASAITVSIPLVEMNATTGCTVFWPGSHRTDEPSDDLPFATPELGVGSLAIWDFRVFHRGLANRGDAGRPLLYLTACRPYWIDHQNFNVGNAKLVAAQAALDALDEEQRARFVRAQLRD